jgi:nucleoside-diphosphate-sugar epimerase
MNPEKTVVVTGASSQLGVFLLPRLQAADYRVTAISRQASAEPLQLTKHISWARPQHVSNPVSCLVSCGPIELAGDWLEKESSLEKAVVFSTSSVLTKPDSADREEREKILAILAEETRLKKRCAERGIKLTLVRPTLIYGCGMDRNISQLLRIGQRMGYVPLARDARGLRQPVHADDLAALAVAALGAETGGLLEGEACGSSTLSYREMVERIACCGNRTIRLLALPGSVLAALVRIASMAGPLKGANAEMVRRQSIDMTFDNSVFREALGWNPRTFNPTPDDFRVPREVQKYRLPTQERL